MRQAVLRRAALGAMLGLLAAAAPAGAKTLHGTVVHENAGQSTFVLAAHGGRLTVISARHLPRISRVADVKVRSARSGTATARRIRTRGTARRAVLRGRVSFADAHSFALSANGASILIQNAGRAPRVGDNAVVHVSFGPGDELDADETTTSPAPSTRPMKIEGTIEAIDPVARTLTVSADDDMGDSSGDDSASAADDNQPATVVVHVPDAIDITQFAVGDQVELIVVPQADSSFLLQSVDEDDQGEDQGNDSGDSGVQQGDDNGGDTNSGEAGSGGEGGSSSGRGGGGDG